MTELTTKQKVERRTRTSTYFTNVCFCKMQGNKSWMHQQNILLCSCMLKLNDFFSVGCRHWSAGLRPAISPTALWIHVWPSVLGVLKLRKSFTRGEFTREEVKKLYSEEKTAHMVPTFQLWADEPCGSEARSLARWVFNFDNNDLAQAREEITSIPATTKAKSKKITK